MAKKKKEENNSNHLSLFDTLSREVTYHNDFSNTVFTDFSLREKKILLLLIAGIEKNDDNNKIYHFNPKQIKEMLNMERKSYAVLSKMIYSIQKKPIGILASANEIRTISIFDEVRYNSNDESISVSFGKSAIQLFKNLKGNFSKYFLKNILNLQSENSIEFYLKAESGLYKKENFEISLEEIKKIFNTISSTKDIKRKLISRCINDINENTDIILEVSDIKEGRTIIGFSFKSYRKNLLTENLNKVIEICKKNIYISRSGLFNSSEVEKTIHSLLRSFSEEKLQKGLEVCSKTIKENFKTITYLENAVKFALEKLEKNEKKKKSIVNRTDKRVTEKETESLKIKNQKLFDTEDWFSNFEKLDLNTKTIIENTAINNCIKENNLNKEFLNKMKSSSPTMYYNSLKEHIISAIKNTNLLENKEEETIASSKPKKRGRRKKLDMIDELDKTKEVEKNEKTIKSFMKKKYGKEKMLEIIKSSKNYEELMFGEYINYLREKEKNK